MVEQAKMSPILARELPDCLPSGKALGMMLNGIRGSLKGRRGFRLGPSWSRHVEGDQLRWRGPRAALAPQVVGNCRKLGSPKVFYIAADMASPEVPERVVQFTLDKLGEGRGLESGTLV